METEIKDLYKIVGLLNNGNCAVCRSAENVIKYGNRNISQRYKCTGCGRLFCETSDTIFWNLKLSFSNVNKIVICFLGGLTAKQTSISLSLEGNHQVDYLLSNKVTISIRSLQKWFKFFLSLVHRFQMEYMASFRFNEAVEIDEACIYRKKTFQGRPRQFSYWVFGLKGRETKKCLIFPVMQRTRQVLLQIIAGTKNIIFIS